MTKAKAVEILNRDYDALSCRRMLCNKPDDVDYLNDLLIALLTAIDALEQDNGWISVKDRMPDEDTWVLVYSQQGSYMNLKVDYIHGGKWVNSMLVTHWQPLPEPPKENISREESDEQLYGGYEEDRKTMIGSNE